MIKRLKAKNPWKLQFLAGVEGECERWYLEHLRYLINQVGNDYTVSFECFKNIRPLSMMKRMKLDMYDGFFYLWDRENGTEGTEKNFCYVFSELLQVQKEKKKLTIEPGYSHLSFELWILLHKQEMNGHMTKVRDYLELINETFHTDFKTLRDYKAERNFKEKILGQITLEDVVKAIQLARKLRNHCESVKKVSTPRGKYLTYDTNPDLWIHECIAIVLKKCGIPQ